MVTRTIFNSGGLPPLEEADRMLLAQLAVDPRASGRDLAKVLGCSEANISRRLNRLLNEHAVRIRAFMPHTKAGMFASALLRVACADPSTLANRLNSADWVQYLATTGPLDGKPTGLLMVVCASNGHELIALIDAHLADAPGVTAIDTAVLLDQFGPATHRDDKPSGRGASSVDHANRQIIRALQANGRATFAALGDAAGISSTAAAERFRHLVDDGVIRIVAIPEESRLGRSVRATFSITPIGSVQRAFAAAKSLATPDFAAIVSGSHSVVIECCQPNTAAMLLLGDQLRAQPWADNVSLEWQHEVLKESFVWCPAE